MAPNSPQLPLMGHVSYLLEKRGSPDVVNFKEIGIAKKQGPKNIDTKTVGAHYKDAQDMDPQFI